MQNLTQVDCKADYSLTRRLSEKSRFAVRITVGNISSLNDLQHDLLHRVWFLVNVKDKNDNVSVVCRDPEVAPIVCQR